MVESGEKLGKSGEKLEKDSSEVIEEKGNRFVAHLVNITTPNDIPNGLLAVKNSHHLIATATHNMSPSQRKTHVTNILKLFRRGK